MNTRQRSGSLLVLLGAVLISACGGGGGSGSGKGGGRGGASPSAPGVLTDSPVAGVAYQTSGNWSGTTDGNGQFRYNPGETVIFRIGQLELGRVTPPEGGARVTPLDLVRVAGLSEVDQQTRVGNLLVLLQSLDSDGNPENGISIAPAAIAALESATVAAGIDLGQANTVFASNPVFTGVVSAAGTTVVDIAQAREHFTRQFFKEVAGVHWLEKDGAIIVFRINEDARYIMAEIDDDEAGIEIGMLNWNPLTGEVHASDISLDTNGERGLSDLLVTETSRERIFFSVENGNLRLRIVDGTDGNEVLDFTRVPLGGSGIQGVWVLDDGSENVAASQLRQQFIFLADGRYLMLDPVGDESDEPCGEPGLELGSFSLDGNVFKSRNVLVDSNGCAGLHDADTGTNAVLVYERVNDNAFRLQESGEAVMLKRASAGAYLLP